MSHRPGKLLKTLSGWVLALQSVACAAAMSAVHGPSVSRPEATAPDSGSLKTVVLHVLKHNPELLRARAEHELRTVDIDEARSGMLPSVGAKSSIGLFDQTNSFSDAPGSAVSGRTSSIGVELRQPVFSGLTVRHALRRTRAEIEANQHAVAAREQEILLDTITAYADVLKDRQILQFTEDSLDVLRRQLQFEENRFQVGDNTRTDVSQARSAVSISQGLRADALSTLENSRALFQSLTGYPPHELAPLPPIPEVPHSLDSALEIARRESPKIKEIRLLNEAATFGVREARGAYLPKLDLSVEVGRLTGPVTFGAFVDRQETVSTIIGLNLRVPIYQAGSEYSGLKRARRLKQRRSYEYLATIESVDRRVRSAWFKLRSSRASVTFAGEAVRTAGVAADGTRREAEFGDRDLFDVLSSEQTYLGANVSLAQAERNLHTAVYSLLAAAGSLEISEIGDSAQR